MSYKCRHFAIEELTPPGFQNWSLLDDRILETLDEIHDRLSEKYEHLAMEVNTWKKGGKFKYRGWRPKDCATGSQNSFHKRGMAADFDAYHLVGGVKTRIDPDEVRAHIVDLKLRQGSLEHLGGLETGVNWVHVDSRPYPGLLQFSS